MSKPALSSLDVDDETFERLLMDYLDGSLDADGRKHFAALIAEFPHRRQQLETLQSIEKALKTLGSAIEDEPIPAHLLRILDSFEE